MVGNGLRHQAFWHSRRVTAKGTLESHKSLRQAFADDLARLPHDARDEFLASWDVVDQPDHHASRPNASVDIALFVDKTAALAADKRSKVLDRQIRTLGPLDGFGLFGHAVAEEAGRIAQAAHEQCRVQLARRDDA